MTPASAMATSTPRKRSVGATTATRSMRAGSRTSRHRIEYLRKLPAAARGDGQRRPGPPCVSGEQTHYPNCRGWARVGARCERCGGRLDGCPPTDLGPPKVVGVVHALECLGRRTGQAPGELVEGPGLLPQGTEDMGDITAGRPAQGG